MLALMNNATALELAALAEQVKAWQGKIAASKEEAERLTDGIEEFDDLGAADEPMALVGSALEIATALELIAKKSAALDQYIKYNEKIAPLLRKAEEQWKSAPFDPEKYFDIDEAEFRGELKQMAQAYAAAELLKLYDAEIFALLQELGSPAEYAKGFLKGQFDEWWETPQEHEVLEGLKFTIKKPDPGVSVFDPNGGLTIEVEYAALGGAKVQARGLYFEYDPNSSIPKPNLSKLKPQADWKSLLPVDELSSLGALSVDLGLGFTVSDFELFLDRPDESGRRGGLKFTAAVKIPIEEFPQVTGTGVVYPLEGEVRWIGEIEAASEAPMVPLGTTGAGMHGYKIKFLPLPGKERLTVETRLSTASPGSAEAVNLDVALSIPFPIKEISIEGKIKLANTLTVGKVSGTFDFTRGKVEADFDIPGDSDGPPLPVLQMFKMRGRMKITGEGIEADGTASLFEQSINKAKLFVSSDGHGRLTTEGLKLCGDIDVSSRLDAGFKPGFSELWARAVFDVGVDLGPIKAIDVSVQVNASTLNEPLPVRVVLNAWSKKVSLHLPTLTALDYAALLTAIQKHMPDLYDAVLAAMAQGEEDVRGALAKAEKDFKAEIDRAVSDPGFNAVRTGNKDLDQALGRISTAGKQAGDELAEQGKQLGKTLTELGKNPKGTLEELTGTLAGNVANVGGGVLSPLVGGGGGGGGSSGPSREEVEKQVRQAKVEEKLIELRAKLDQVAVQRAADEADSKGKHHHSNHSHLRLHFRNVASELEGKHDAVVALLVSSSGFQSAINTRRAVKQTADSDARPAYVRLRNFVVDENSEKRPTAQIAVPELKHASTFNARRIAHYEIQRLLELHLPDVEIEGPKTYVESQLAVHNRTKEPITVWVQTRSRRVEEAQYQWAWSPGDPATPNAHRFVIDPGQKQLLEIKSGRRAAKGAELEPRPLTASRVRIWAESETGERWMSYRGKDLWLEKRPSSGVESPAYFADAIRTYTHVIEPKSGGRVYNERLIRMTNKTNEPLTVDLRYRSSEGGTTLWRTLKSFVIAPHARGYPTTSEGMKVRASQLVFSAQSEHFRFGEHEKKPLYSVEQVDGRRLYFAEKIGVFEHVFAAPLARAEVSK